MIGQRGTFRVFGELGVLGEREGLKKLIGQSGILEEIALRFALERASGGKYVSDRLRYCSCKKKKPELLLQCGRGGFILLG